MLKLKHNLTYINLVDYYHLPYNDRVNFEPENGRLHRHFGLHFLNFDAKSILSTKKDPHLIANLM